MEYILNTSILQCPHGGMVSLAKATDCGIEINNKFPVLKQHIMGATITGCPVTNNPCLTVASVPPSCFAEDQIFNNDQILTDKVDGNAMTNAGGKIKLVSI